MAKGKVILVAGLYCAGKTTLIGAALRRIPELSYITTYTTRQPRPSELAGTHEYAFVDDDQYEQLSRRTGWDHTRLRGVSYGADAGWVNSEVARGRSFIVVKPLNEQSIGEAKKLYAGPPVLLLLDTDWEVCRQRIAEPGSGRDERYLNDPTQTPEYAAHIRSMADFVYQPRGSLAADSEAFPEFVRSIINEG